MPAGVYNIPLIEQGSTYTLECLYKDSTGGAIDLTDYIGRGKIKTSAVATSSVAEFEVTIPFPKSEGKIIIELPPDRTASIPTKGASYLELTQYVYDVEIENTVTHEVIRILNGNLKVSPEVTK